MGIYRGSASSTGCQIVDKIGHFSQPLSLYRFVQHLTWHALSEFHAALLSHDSTEVIQSPANSQLLRLTTFPSWWQVTSQYSIFNEDASRV